MLPSVVWEMPKLGCFNLHASLLPDYRGAAPLNHVLINGEHETGITTFLIDKQIDTGLILLQEKTRIVPSDNAGSLHDRLMEMGGPLVARTIDGLWAGTLKGMSQPDTQAEKLNPAPKIYRETCLIHWDREATQIVNLIRGLSPVPCAFGMLKKDDSVTEIKIYEARAEHDQHSLPPGKIITDGKKIFKVACRDGYIHLNEVRAPGRKKLDIASFLAGFRDPGDARFI
jgi:methionyl-tRNA formyltransferase